MIKSYIAGLNIYGLGGTMILLKRSITRTILWTFIGAMIFNIIEGLSRIFLAANTGRFVNVASKEVDYSLIKLLILGLLYSLMLMVSIYIKEACYARALEKTLANIRTGLYDRLVSIDFAWMKKNNVNELTAVISNDLNTLTDALRPWVVMNFSQQVLRIMSTIYLLSVNWLLTLILLSIIPLFTWIHKRLIKPLKKHANENQIIMGRIAATASFCFSQRELIKAMALEDMLLGRFSQEQSLLYRIGRKERTYKAISQSLGMATRLFTILLLFGAGAYFVLSNRMNIGQLISFYALAYGVIRLPSGLASLFADGQKLLVCLERTNEVYNIPIEEEWTEGEFKNLPHSLATLEFENVSFSYEGRDEILNNTSFEIMPGETVLLYGENGSGKSTIFSLITGFYRTISGNIYLSGSNIRSIPIKTLRRRICYIPQEPVLFYGSIYDNVTCFRQDISRESVREILNKLKLDDTINRLPQGIDSQVGERGSLLSGGERQRILLARCLITTAEIILLDEVAAGLGEEEEDRILSMLKELPHKPAILYISHREIIHREITHRRNSHKDIYKADRVLYLKEGRIYNGIPGEIDEGVSDNE